MTHAAVPAAVRRCAAVPEKPNSFNVRRFVRRWVRWSAVVPKKPNEINVRWCCGGCGGVSPIPPTGAHPFRWVRTRNDMESRGTDRFYRLIRDYGPAAFPRRADAHGSASIGIALSLAVTLSSARLGPDRRDPKAFDVAKSPIVADLRRLARAAPRIARDAACNWGAR